MPDLSVVIPVQNEEENIRLLIDEVRKSLDGVLDYELIYVNDGSTDSTLAEMIARAGTLPIAFEPGTHRGRVGDEPLLLDHPQRRDRGGARDRVAAVRAAL